MLDVHPPHEPAHSWLDFFIHIATIVVGLLIAIGLEQTVEYFHHRHEVHEARAALAEEHRENIRRYHNNVRTHLLLIADVHNDQRLLRFLLAHPGTPQDKLPGIMSWGASITIDEPVESAWTTVQHTDVASLLPPAELRAYAAEYTKLDREATMYDSLQARFADCASYLTYTSDITTLDRDQVRSTLNCLVLTQSLAVVYGDQLSVIGSMKDYGPRMGHWQMVPFFNMQKELAFADAHPDLKALTSKDEEEALVPLPKPDPTQK